jgi:hypothetical protein
MEAFLGRSPMNYLGLRKEMEKYKKVLNSDRLQLTDMT